MGVCQVSVVRSPGDFRARLVTWANAVVGMCPTANAARVSVSAPSSALRSHLRGDSAFTENKINFKNPQTVATGKVERESQREARTLRGPPLSPRRCGGREESGHPPAPRRAPASAAPPLGPGRSARGAGGASLFTRPRRPPPALPLVPEPLGGERRQGGNGGRQGEMAAKQEAGRRQEQLLYIRSRAVLVLPRQAPGDTLPPPRSRLGRGEAEPPRCPCRADRGPSEGSGDTPTPPAPIHSSEAAGPMGVWSVPGRGEAGGGVLQRSPPSLPGGLRL